MTTQTPSKACCTVPPASHEYKPQGEYIDVGGMKTYTYGPASATSAVLIIFDIFGFYPQTLQGADILATGDSEKPRRVFMPDWFDGKPWPLERFPPSSPEDQKLFGEFWNGPANLGDVSARIPALLKDIEAKVEGGGNIKKWGIVGYCWGGKVAGVSSQSGTPFSAAAECHPAMVDPSDAEKTSIPIAMLPSKDEDVEAVASFKKALKVPNVVETFSDQVHGWMAARGDFKNKRTKDEYERGYKILLDFYHQHL